MFAAIEMPSLSTISRAHFKPLAWITMAVIATAACNAGPSGEPAAPPASHEERPGDPPPLPPPANDETPDEPPVPPAPDEEEPVPPSEPPAIGPESGHAGYYRIVSINSDKCLDVRAGASGNNAALIQHGCDAHAANQQFYIRPYRDGFQIRARHSGRCLAVRQNSADYTPILADHAPVVQYDCTGDADQLWQLGQTEGAYQLIASPSSKCIGVEGGSLNDGAPITQHDCTGALDELFHIHALGPAVTTQPGLGGKTYRLIVAHSDACANVHGMSEADGAQIVQARCTGAPNEQWALQASGDGYRLVARNSGKCLDVQNASAVDGARVVQRGCNGTDSQIWFAQPVADAFQLTARHSNRCLAASESIADGGSLTQSACHGGGNQRWYLREVSAPAAQIGQWGAKIGFPSVPVAAALLPDGNVLTWSSWDRYDYVDGHGERDKTHTALYDPARHAIVSAASVTTGHDMFCPGTAMLPDGRVHVAGGGHVVRTTSIFDFRSNSWMRDADMIQQRWYNTSVTLADGGVFTLGGHRLTHGDGSGEIWREDRGWSPIPDARMEPLMTGVPMNKSEEHPQLKVAPDGRLFAAGPATHMQWYDLTGGGSVESAGVRGDDKTSQAGVYVMYNVGKILKAGGNVNYDSDNAESSPSNRTAYLIDINSGTAVTERVPSMRYARAFANGVVLPDGKVLVVGGLDNGRGFSDTGAAMIPELFDPATKAWTEMAPLPTPRTYHSVALLLPDGRVFAGGGGLCGACDVNHPDAEVYSPPYLFKGPRPAITSAPDEIRYDTWNLVATDKPVSRFTLVRLSSVTHGVNTDQRLVPLAFSAAGTDVYWVLAPDNPNIAPAGYYMLFALDANDVPSVAQIVKLRS